MCLYKKKLVVRYSQVVYKYWTVRQILGYTHNEPNCLAVFIIQHICNYNRQRSVLPRGIWINGWFRNKPQCVQIIFINHQFFLFSYFQIVLKRKQNAGIEKRLTRPHNRFDYFKVFEVVNLFVRFRDQRLNSWPAQTILKH